MRGSIRKRSKDSWTLIFDGWKKPDGSRRQRTTWTALAILGLLAVALVFGLSTIQLRSWGDLPQQIAADEQARLDALATDWR